MSYRTIIVDDEAPARRRVKMLVEKFTDLEIIAECRNGKDAIKTLNVKVPDLIFLDIQLGDMHGFDVLKSLKGISPVIIFITAYDEFAIKAFNHFAFDFILKPYSNERFKESVEKVIQHLKSQNSFGDKINELLEFLKEKEASMKYGEKYLHVKKDNRVILVKVPDIIYLRASGNYCELFLHKAKYLIRDAIGLLEKKLPDEDFIRIHRSAIVNINFVEEVVHSQYGEIDIKMKDGKLLRISRSYQESFLKKIGLR